MEKERHKKKFCKIDFLRRQVVSKCLIYFWPHEERTKITLKLEKYYNIGKLKREKLRKRLDEIDQDLQKNEILKITLSTEKNKTLNGEEKINQSQEEKMKLVVLMLEKLRMLNDIEFSQMSLVVLEKLFTEYSGVLEDNNEISSKIYVEAALTQILQSNFKKAREFSKKAIELDPKNSDAYVLRARGLCDDQLKEKNALEDIEISISLNPENNVKAFLRKSILIDHEFEEALELLNKVKKIDPYNQYYYLNKAWIYSYQNSLNKNPACQKKSVLLTLKSMLIEPRASYGYINIGNNSIGPHSIRFFTYAIDLLRYQPIAYVYLNRGIKYYRSGKYEESLNDFRDLLKIMERYDECGKFYRVKPSNIYYHISSVHKEDGKFEESLKYICKSIEMRPNYYNYRLAKGDIYARMKNVIEVQKNYFLASELQVSEGVINYRMRELLSPQTEEVRKNNWKERFEKALVKFDEIMDLKKDFEKKDIHVMFQVRCWMKRMLKIEEEEYESFINFEDRKAVMERYQFIIDQKLVKCCKVLYYKRDLDIDVIIQPLQKLKIIKILTIP